LMFVDKPMMPAPFQIQPPNSQPATWPQYTIPFRQCTRNHLRSQILQRLGRIQFISFKPCYMQTFSYKPSVQPWRSKLL
jgi:hypothetical protein